MRGEFNILAKMREVIVASRNELMFATIVLPKTIVNLFLPDLNRLRNLGVDMKIILVDGVDDKSLEMLSEFGEVRLKERMFGGGIISDRRRVILLLGGGRDSEPLAICSDHLGLAGLSREYFEYLWKEARRVP